MRSLEGLSKKEKGLMDMYNSVGGGDIKRTKWKKYNKDKNNHK